MYPQQQCSSCQKTHCALHFTIITVNHLYTVQRHVVLTEKHQGPLCVPKNTQQEQARWTRTEEEIPWIQPLMDRDGETRDGGPGDRIGRHKGNWRNKGEIWTRACQQGKLTNLYGEEKGLEIDGERAKMPPRGSKEKVTELGWQTKRVLNAPKKVYAEEEGLETDVERANGFQRKGDRTGMADKESAECTSGSRGATGRWRALSEHRKAFSSWREQGNICNLLERATKMLF